MSDLSTHSTASQAPNNESHEDPPMGFRAASNEAVDKAFDETFDETFDDPCSNPYVDFHTYDFSLNPILGQIANEWQADFLLDNRFLSSNSTETPELGLLSNWVPETSFERDLINSAPKRSTAYIDTIGSGLYHPINIDLTPVNRETDISKYYKSYLTGFQEDTTQYISPALIFGSSLELPNTSAVERTIFGRQPKRGSTPEPSATHDASTRSKKTSKRARSCSPSSETKREPRCKHQTGINPETEHLPLLRRFLPKIINNLYTCPLPECGGLSWTTGNGYKYHLKEVCPQNPLSKRSVKIASGLPVRGPRLEGVPVIICNLCGHKFVSDNGIRLHQRRNPGTRDGRCAQKKSGEGQKSHGPGD